MSTVDFSSPGSGKSSPRSASGTPGSTTWGKGDTPFIVPDYGEDSTANRDRSQPLRMPENAAVSKLREDSRRCHDILIFGVALVSLLLALAVWLF